MSEEPSVLSSAGAGVGIRWDGVHRGGRTAWVDQARILAAFGVVVIHVAANVVLTEQPGSSNWWIGFLLQSLVRWSVPVFVMVSGMLLLDPRRAETASQFYRKRVSRVLIPLLAWTLFYLLWAYKGKLLRGESVPWTEAIQRVVVGKPFYHMWFLYMLMGLYLITPLLRRVVEWTSPRRLLALTAALFAIPVLGLSWINPEPAEDRVFIVYSVFFIPYFLAGYVVGTTAKRPNNVAAFAMFLTALGAILLGSYLSVRRGNPQAASSFHGNLSLTVILLSISMMVLLRNLSVSTPGAATRESLASLTLGVYLVHPVLIDVLEYAGVFVVPARPAVSIIILSLLVFGISLGVIRVLQFVPFLRRVV